MAHWTGWSSGGTQTDRSVLLRREPVLGRTRAALLGGLRTQVVATLGLARFADGSGAVAAPRVLGR